MGVLKKIRREFIRPFDQLANGLRNVILPRPRPPPIIQPHPDHLNMLNELQRQVNEQNKKNAQEKRQQEQRLKQPSNMIKEIEKHEDNYVKIYLQSIPKKSTRNINGDLFGIKQRRILLIGLTSCGKTTLLNDIFGINNPTGLGKTTDKVTVAYQNSKVSFSEVPGFNQDFHLYQEETINLLNSTDKVYIIFDRCVDDLRFIIKVCRGIGMERGYIRTKCDLHQRGMVQIGTQLSRDLAEIMQYDPEAKEVLSSGKGMNGEIKALFKKESQR